MREQWEIIQQGGAPVRSLLPRPRGEVQIVGDATPVGANAPTVGSR